MRDNYNACLVEILKYEGGYVNHPKDPGGATNYGITLAVARKFWKADATAVDMKSMPLDVAKKIYRAQYWDAVAGDDLPAGVDLATFDPAVNSGPGRAKTWLAKAIGATPRPFPELAKLSASLDPVEVVRGICAARLSFLQGLKTWATFGKGWGNRVASVKAKATTMAMKAKGASPQAIIAVQTQDLKTVKEDQNITISSGTLGSGGSATAGYTLWAWDFTHIAFVLGAIFLLGAIVWRVVQNIHQAQAIEAEIAALEAELSGASNGKV